MLLLDIYYESFDSFLLGRFDFPPRIIHIALKTSDFPPGRLRIASASLFLFMKAYFSTRRKLFLPVRNYFHLEDALGRNFISLGRLCTPWRTFSDEISFHPEDFTLPGGRSWRSFLKLFLCFLSPP